MNLQPQDLPDLLAKQLPPVCVLIGEETVLVQDCLMQIRQRAADEGLPAREFVLTDSSTDWDGLCAHLASGSLFAERHFVELMVPAAAGGRRNPDEGIERVLETISAEDILLISLPKLGRGNKPKWLQSAGKTGIIVKVDNMRGRDERRWIQQQLKKRRLKLTTEQQTLLCEYTEGNPLAARMEMDRLQLLAMSGDKAGDKAGDSADADDERELAVEDVGQLDVFQLADACLAGQAERALRALQLVRAADSGSGPLVFHVLGRHLLSACRLLWKQQQGMSLSQALAEEQVWPREKRNLAAFLQRVPAARIRAVALRMSSLDANIKGRGDGDPWRALTGLVLAFCGLFPLSRPAPVRRR